MTKPNLLSILPGAAVSVVLTKGQKVRIINAEGGQVVDTWGFNISNPDEHLSMEHSRSAIYSLWFKPGDTLVSNLFNPMLTMTADTSPGKHDTLHAACSPGSYRFYGEVAGHPNCQDNLKAQLKQQGLTLETIPCPWNLFEHAIVDGEMRLSDTPATADKGDYVELAAEQDLILVCSACPSRVGNINGRKPRGACVEIFPACSPG